jgi:fatty-acyl-CoA synthase
VRGSIVKLLDEHGKEVPAGESGRIFVGNISQFEGYTGGGNKDVVEGLMASGDVGHFDADGRLFIDGRDDEMIVSGGENVFPAEVEELLSAHDSIQEAAAIGVEDEKFGQRLKAFVVPHNGAKLTEDEIKSYVKDNLANYKVPREVVFLDELPRNPTGKVLKRDLEEQGEEGDDSESGQRPQKSDGKSKPRRQNGKSSAANQEGAKASSKKAST